MELLDYTTKNKLTASEDTYMAIDGWFVNSILGDSDTLEDEIYNENKFVIWCRDHLGYYPYSVTRGEDDNECYVAVYFKKRDHAALFRLRWL
jgi:hypothetical protein